MDKEAILKRIKRIDQVTNEGIGIFCSVYQCEECPLFDKCDDIISDMGIERERLLVQLKKLECKKK